MAEILKFNQTNEDTEKRHAEELIRINLIASELRGKDGQPGQFPPLGDELIKLSKNKDLMGKLSQILNQEGMSWNVFKTLLPENLGRTTEALRAWTSNQSEENKNNLVELLQE